MTGTALLLHLPTPSRDTTALAARWCHAFTRAGVRLARSDGHATDMHDAIHLVLCGPPETPDGAGTDFLTAVAKARALVAAGARRIVFVICGGPQTEGMCRSLNSFSQHAGRAVNGKRVFFQTRTITASDPDGPIAQILAEVQTSLGSIHHKLPALAGIDGRHVHPCRPASASI